ncbi:MAG: hypothetical protein V5A88_06460, partial [Candidatus Thermoplasmatota archaeon]
MAFKNRFIVIAVGLLLMLSVFSGGAVSDGSFDESGIGERSSETVSSEYDRLENSGISIDSTSNITVSNVPQNDIFSWPHAIGEGENMVMIVSLSWSPNSAEGVSVMYGSQALQRVTTESNDVRTEIWILKDPDPPGGVEYIDVEVGGADADDVIAGAITFAGVDQNDPFYGVTGRTEEDTSISVDVNSLPHDMVVDVVAQTGSEGEGNATANQTVQWSDVGSENGMWGAGSNKRADSGTTTMSWDCPAEDVTVISALTLAVDPPEINVTRPSGGEEWDVGAQKEIEWKTTEGAGNITSVDLDLSLDGGGNWEAIDHGLNDTGSYSWAVPDENSDQCQIRATVHDENNRDHTDISGTFSIGESPAPPENVTVEHDGSPNVADPIMVVFDNFSDGDYSSDPEWTVYDGNWRADQGWLEGQGRISSGESTHWAYGRWEYNFSLERTDFHDQNNYQRIGFYFIQTGDPNPANANGYFVTVTGELEVGQDPQITLLRADGGTPTALNSTDWNADTDWHNLTIERDESHEFSIYLDGEMILTAMNNTYTASEYKGFLSQGVTQQDDHNFDDIRIPKGTEDNLITWKTSPDDPGNVNHYNIYRSAEKTGPWNESTRIASIDADGSANYSYIDPDKGEADDTYWWYLVRAVGEIEEDNSKAVREPGPPHVKVNRPDGGEVWNAYEDRTIEWNMTEGYDEIDHVNLYSSNDGGETWDEVVTGLAPTDNHAWTVSNYNSSECLVKVEAVDIEGRVGEAVSDDYFTVLGEPPQPPENLNVEHSNPLGELIENGIFMDDYQPWNLTRLQFEGDSRWHENSYQADGSGSIYSIASQSGGGVTTEEAYWEQDVVNTSSQITVNGAYNKNIWLEQNQCDVTNATVEILVNDTQGGWKTIYSDYDNAEQNSEWIEFGPDATYQPSGKVVSVRAYMKVVAEGIGADRTAIGELWMDNISVVSDGTGGDDHNLVTWDASPDDPDEVAQYNIYRSKDRDGPWDETALIANVTADGSPSYSYLDEDRGMVDDIYWWYVVRAVGENGLEENNTDEKQEPAVVDHIEVTPQDSTVTAGENQGYNATAYDQNGNKIREVTAQTDWSNESGAGGNWNNNVYTSKFAGTWNVTGTYTQGGDEFNDNATLIVEPAGVSYVKINPDTDQTITAGETIDFSAGAYDQYDNLIDDEDTNFTWENTDNTGLFDQTTVGDYDVTATYESEVSQITTVTVESSEVNYVVIDPDTDQTITAGETIDFSAGAYDQYDNLIDEEDTNFSWENTDNTGLFDQTTAGAYDVTATYGDTTSPTTTVTVEPAELDHIEIEPEYETIPAGENITYHASAYDEFANLIGDVTADTVWSIEEDAGGEWIENEYHSENIGEWIVTGTYTVNGTDLLAEATLNVISMDDPWVDIISPQEGEMIHESDVLVEWRSENTEYHEIRLNEDRWIEVGMDTSHKYEGLDGGDHIIEVKAVRGDSSSSEEQQY